MKKEQQPAFPTEFKIILDKDMPQNMMVVGKLVFDAFGKMDKSQGAVIHNVNSDKSTNAFEEKEGKE